jgi:glycosyltransferase involved in cell wall biosynthesis
MKDNLTVWVFQTGEPLPSDDGEFRPMRAINLSNALVEAGHNVVIWSSAFNHQKKTHRSKEFNSIILSESLMVNLIPSPGYKKNISTARLLDHFILAKNFKKLLKLEKKRPDVVFIGYPPIEAAYILTQWLKSQNIPCLLDVKDQWPSFMVDALPNKIKAMGRIFFSPYFFIAKKTMRDATGLSAMAEDFLDWALNFSKRQKTALDIVVPLTAPNHMSLEGDLVSALKWWSSIGVTDNGKMKIMFVGSHYPSLDFSTIFEAAGYFLDSEIDCDFIICGNGELTAGLKKIARRFSNVFLPGWVDRPKIEALASLSSASISPFRNIDSYIKSLPNKVIDSLSFGLPILSPLQGEVQRLIESEEVGLVYIEGSGKSLFQCINKLISSPELSKKLSLNAINLYNNKFSYEIVYGGLVNHINQLSCNFNVSNNYKA